MDGDLTGVFPTGTTHGGTGSNPLCPYNKLVKSGND